MDYIKRLLGTNETIIFQTRQHLFVILGHIVRELVILGVLIAGIFILSDQLPSQYLMYFYFAFGILALVVLGSMFFDIVKWRTEQYTVTSHRVIHTHGILSKRVLDSSLNKINDVELQQSWLGRIFNYGTIRILTATDDVINLMQTIAKPIAFKRAMLDAKAAQEGDFRAAPAPAATAVTPARQALEDLAELKAKNLISDAEYEEKRKEILKRF